MYITITSLYLKSPLKFFALSLYAMKIMRQLKAGKAIDVKTTGFWTKHYTMSLWQSEADLKAFAMSGAHLEAMKKSASIAREIRTYTTAAEELPDWKSAKALLLEKGRLLQYGSGGKTA